MRSDAEFQSARSFAMVCGPATDRIFLHSAHTLSYSVTRIFLTLSALGIGLLATAFLLGLNIDDPRVRDLTVQKGISLHMMTGLGGLVFSALVHAIVITYFMGTGRWIEETSRAYKLSGEAHAENQKIKYRLMPLITGCILLLILTGGFGGAADPASPVNFQGWLGLSPAAMHLSIAALAIALTLATHIREFHAIERNGAIIESVMSEVRRMRSERGLTD